MSTASQSALSFSPPPPAPSLREAACESLARESGVYVPLNDREWAVYKILIGRRGRANAIRNAEMQKLAALNERDIKAAVEGLRLRHGMKIAASREKPYGYYLIETSDELMSFEDCYFGQIVQMLRVMHAMRGKRDGYYRELTGQILLELEAQA